MNDVITALFFCVFGALLYLGITEFIKFLKNRKAN